LYSSQGELLSHLRKEQHQQQQQQQQQRYEQHHLLRSAPSSGDSYRPLLGPAYPPLGAAYPPRDEPTNQALRRSPFPPLRVGGSSATYGPYGNGGSVSSPRPAFHPPPKESATPPKQLLSPLDKAAISSLAR
jgi:hypothetical protein